jgi:predicted transport protein
MSDVKLFNLASQPISELSITSAHVEKSLQNIFEQNLETLLGVRFLSSEHSTGAKHGGRIDTLGIDEDGSPVIIEYKRATSENVINQGLFYLDWLLDHKKDFEWLVLKRLGEEVADNVDWSAPRLICIAGDFTRYDGHAVNQMPRNIELIRYRRFENDFLLIELVHAPKVAVKTPIKDSHIETSSIETGTLKKDPYLSQRIDNRIAKSSGALRDLWDSVYAYIPALGDDIQIVELKFYVAFKKIKNFVCLEIYPQAQTVVAYLKLDPDSIQLEAGFTRDVRKVGHFGTGDLEVMMRTLADFEKAQPLFQAAYESG